MSRFVFEQSTDADEACFVEWEEDPQFRFFWRDDGARGGGEERVTWSLHGEDGETLGLSTLLISERDRTAELGYAVSPGHWGAGIGTAAAQWAVAQAFDVLTLEKVWCHIDPRNAASVRVAEKVGMRREGLLRQHVVRRGERCDRLLFGLLRTDPRPANATDNDRSALANNS